MTTEKHNWPLEERVAEHNKPAEHLAELKAYAEKHLRDFYEAGWDPEIEELLPERFRTIVEYIRPLIDQLPLSELISELAATNAFSKYVEGQDLERYLCEELRLLALVGTLFRAANRVHEERLNRENQLLEVL